MHTHSYADIAISKYACIRIYIYVYICIYVHRCIGSGNAEIHKQTSMLRGRCIDASMLSEFINLCITNYAYVNTYTYTYHTQIYNRVPHMSKDTGAYTHIYI